MTMARKSSQPWAAKTDVVKTRRSIQSVEIGFRLIRTLEQAPGPLSLKLLSQRSGMEPSKAHLYLVSFCNVGLVIQDDAGYYELGPYALQLGLSALNKIDVAQLARKTLLELRDATGEAASLAVWGFHGPVIVAKVDSLKDDPLVVRLGRTLRLTSSAAGKVFIAFGDGDIVNAYLAREIGSARLDRRALRVIRESVKTQGYARSDSLLHSGFSSLAAPMFDHEGVLAGAITVLGLSENLGADAEKRVSATLLEQTRRLSEKLGYRPDLRGMTSGLDEPRSSKRPKPIKRIVARPPPN